MKTNLKRVIAGAGTAALLGGSLMLGAGAANAATCAAGEHYVDLGTMGGYCAPDASGGGTGGSTGSYLGGSQAAPVQQAPVQQGPTLGGLPQYGNAPAPAPAPVRQAPVQAPAPQYYAPQAPAGGNGGGGYSGYSNAGGYAPQNYGGTVSSGVRQNPGATYTAPWGATLEQDAQGGWVDASTGQAAPAEDAAAAQASQAPAPADDAAAQQAAQAKAAADAKAAQEKKDAEVKAAVAQAQMTQSVKDAVAQAWSSR